MARVLNFQHFERFTPWVCKALLGFHAFKGSDQTGRFHVFSKQSCWEIFTSSTYKMITLFINLGTTDLNPDIIMHQNLLLSLFTANKRFQLKYPTSQIYDGIFFKKPVRISQDATHTYGALREKILRTHFTALQWMSAHLLEPSLPDPA